MGILSRFADIMKANINALLDKAEDPAKMCDQYLRQMTEDLANVKKETANVMAEESRAKRLYEAKQAEVKKYTDLAAKALQAGNEGDAKTFIAKKQELEASLESLKQTYDVAAANAMKMRQMHDKLVTDIESLKQRRDNIKAKVAVAKTQETLNKYANSGQKAKSAMDAFSRMEEKADNMLDSANAYADLNAEPVDEVSSLEAKYGKGSSASVDDELAAMKAQLGLM